MNTNYFRDHVWETVLGNERTARYLLLELTMRGCKIHRPIADLTHEEVVSICRRIYEELELRENVQ